MVQDFATTAVPYSTDAGSSTNRAAGQAHHAVGHLQGPQRGGEDHAVPRAVGVAAVPDVGCVGHRLVPGPHDLPHFAPVGGLSQLS